MTRLFNSSVFSKNNGGKSIFEKNNNNSKIVKFSISIGDIKLTNRLEKLKKLSKNKNLSKCNIKKIGSNILNFDAKTTFSCL